MNRAIPPDLVKGTKIQVKMAGILVPAEYHSWSEKYNMPLVTVDGRVLPRKIFSSDTLPASPIWTVSPPTVVTGAFPTSNLGVGEVGIKPPFPLTVSTRVEWHTDRYVHFNYAGAKLREQFTTNAGHAHDIVRVKVAD